MACVRLCSGPRDLLAGWLPCLNEGLAAVLQHLQHPHLLHLAVGHRLRRHVGNAAMDVLRDSPLHGNFHVQGQHLEPEVVR